MKNTHSKKIDYMTLVHSISAVEPATVKLDTMSAVSPASHENDAHREAELINILLVEDNPADRRLVAERLSSKTEEANMLRSLLRFFTDNWLSLLAILFVAAVAGQEIMKRRSVGAVSEMIKMLRKQEELREKCENFEEIITEIIFCGNKIGKDISYAKAEMVEKLSRELATALTNYLMRKGEKQ